MKDPFLPYHGKSWYNEHIKFFKEPKNACQTENIDGILASLSECIYSDEFRISARHKDHPTAFTRERKLPLPNLIAFLLSGPQLSVQSSLNRYFADLKNKADATRIISAQAFSQAREKLSATAIPTLNERVIKEADKLGLIPRWRGMRVVGADGSTVKFGLRNSNVKNPATPDQTVFALFLTGIDLMLSASLHSVHENERQSLFENLGCLAEDDLLLLDRGFPCCWLMAALSQRNRPFCVRVEKSGDAGFACVRDFLRSGLAEAVVTLRAPKKQDALDYECQRVPTKVRLIRSVATTGKVRVLMTNLFDQALYPASEFNALYHQRWSVEEGFKRLKHRLNLEHTTGLSQLAVMQDLQAKVVCDNITTLIADEALKTNEVPEDRRVNHAHAHSTLKSLLPRLYLGIEAALSLFDAMATIAKETYKHVAGRSTPRKSQDKPHRFMTQKPC